jgi:pSer/pThr/pTyr-binding forkhead associated (FHA) protein
MNEIQFDEGKSMVSVRLHDALKKEDFDRLAKTVDPHIAKGQHVRGLVLEVSSFPGWSSVGAFVDHVRVVRDHQKQIDKVAIVTDSMLGTLAERLPGKLLSTKIRHFAEGDVEGAKRWIEGEQPS